MSEMIESLLRGLNYSYQLAEWYNELMNAFLPEESDYIDYEKYFNEIDRIWNRLDEARELEEFNDDILDTWEEVHRKACKVMAQIKPITFKHIR